MQVKNADGTIINIKSKADVENPIKDIDNTITITDPYISIADNESGLIYNDSYELMEEVDPFEQWKLAEKLIKMPSWELKYRFGYDNIKCVIDEFDYNEIYDIVEGKNKEELFNQGDIIKIVNDDLYYAVVEMIGTPKGELYLICMHCAPINKFFSINKNTKSIRLCGKPIKVKIEEVSEFISHAKHIKLGW
jgi:hypothetical protein